MPLAVTHVLLTIITVDLVRDFILKKHKHLFSLHVVLIAGIAGLLPDIDMFFRWFFEITGNAQPWLLEHGGITHTPFFALMFLIPGLLFWHYGKKKLGIMFFVTSFGAFFHIMLDLIIGGGQWEGIMLFFPLSFVQYKIHLIHMFEVSNIPVVLDAVILLGWLWYVDYRHKIKDFI